TGACPACRFTPATSPPYHSHECPGVGDHSGRRTPSNTMGAHARTKHRSIPYPSQRHHDGDPMTASLLHPLAGAVSDALRLGGTVRQVSVEGGSLAVETIGVGPPLILLHGWTLDRRMWMPQIAALARRYQLIAYDRRG